jgi:hypothetical protein
MPNVFQPRIDRHPRKPPDLGVDYVSILHVYPKNQRPAISMIEGTPYPTVEAALDALERELEEKVQPGDEIEVDGVNHGSPKAAIGALKAKQAK